MAEKLKITYATLNDSNEEIHIGYEAGLAQARALMGGAHGNFINGTWSTAGDTFVKKSPIDGSVVGTFSKGDRSTAKAAIAAAKATGCLFAGVDLMYDHDQQPYVIEVNAVPGWRGLERACGVDVPEFLFGWLEMD